MRRSCLYVGWGAAFIAAALGWQGTWASTDRMVDVALLGAVELPGAARDLAQRMLDVDDHRRMPFAIVDKHAALIMVYRGDGTLVGASSALLGQDFGDRSTAGVGERAQQSMLRSGDRTTPAGRFASEPGHNLSGEAIVWIDYERALAIHRLRPGASREQRGQRLASTNVQDKRASAGCVVVPEAFYDAVIEPVLGRGRGVVYVMPEDGPRQASGQAR